MNAAITKRTVRPASTPRWQLSLRSIFTLTASVAAILAWWRIFGGYRNDYHPALATWTLISLMLGLLLYKLVQRNRKPIAWVLQIIAIIGAIDAAIFSIHVTDLDVMHGWPLAADEYEQLRRMVIALWGWSVLLPQLLGGSLVFICRSWSRPQLNAASIGILLVNANIGLLALGCERYAYSLKLIYDR
jgi:hypothetical protein